MILVIRSLQVAFLLAWIAPFVLLLPTVARALRGTAGTLDLIRLPHFFSSLLMLALVSRWLIFDQAMPYMTPEELVLWSAIYVVGIGTAIGNVVGLRFEARIR